MRYQSVRAPCAVRASAHLPEVGALARPTSTFILFVFSKEDSAMTPVRSTPRWLSRLGSVLLILAMLTVFVVPAMAQEGIVTSNAGDAKPPACSALTDAEQQEYDSLVAKQAISSLEGADLARYGELAQHLACTKALFEVHPDAASAPQSPNVTKTVGGGGDYATLKLAFDDINAGVLTGAIQLNVIGDTTETATASLNASGVGAASYTAVTIAPSGGPRVITGSIVGAIIKLTGADNVTIDGRIAGAGRNLTVSNSNTAAATAAIWLASTGVGAGATNNVIRNLEIACGATQNTSTNATFGIIMSGASISTSSGGDDNDNNSFIANQIIRARYGIVTRGQTTNNNLNPTVTDNIIGPAAFGPDEIGKVGILMQADTGAVVSRNTVQFVGGCLLGQTCTSGADRVGIGIGNESWSTSSPGTITSGDYTVTRNMVHDVVEERTFSAAGLLVSTTRSGSATNNVIANNFVYNIRANGTSGDQVVGIGIAGGHTDKVVHNSIAITGDMDPAGATAASTYGNAIRIANASGSSHANLSLKDNSIYMDVNSNTATLPYFAITVNSATYSFGTGGMDYNNLYVNLANTQMNTGGLSTGSTAPSGATLFNTLAQWKTALAPAQDAVSIQSDPLYVSNTADLHIPVGSPNAGAGVDVGIPDDIDGQLRDGTVDIGADDPTGVTPPANDMKATAFVNPTSGDTKAVAVAFTPQATFTNLGTNAQTGVTVRFRIVDSLLTEVYNNTQTIASIAGGGTTSTVTFASVTLSTPGTYTMYAKAELIGDTVPGNDEITGTFSVEAPLAGTYTVGSGGNYASLTNDAGIFQKLNQLGASANVTINIISDLSGETGTHSLNELLGGVAVLIKPSGAPRTITGSVNGALIKLNGADGVRIDGSTAATFIEEAGGNPALRELTIQNTNTGTSAWMIAIQSGANGAQNNTIKNVNVLGQDPTTTLGGISLGGNTPGNAGADNDGNRVENCSFKRAIVGIYSAGVSTANPNTGTVITMNDLSATGTDRIRRIGILVFNEDGIQITENSVGGIETNESADAFGIGVGTQAMDTTTTTASGGIINAFVSRNKVNGVNSASTTGFSAAGIAVAGGSGGPNTIVNNMITGVTAPATSPDLVAGIYVIGATSSNTRLYYNSVSMTGDRGTVASQMPSYGLAVTGTDPTVTAKNNIFYTTQTSGGGVTAKSYAIGMVTTTFANLDSNYNDFWSTGANDGGFRSGSLGSPAGTDYATLADWQLAVSDDANSIEADPVFLNPVNDLHIDPSALRLVSPVNDAGTPISGITVDFDGGTRGATMPDIGGDEIGSALAVTLASFAAQAQTNQVFVTWETVSELNNTGFNLYRSSSVDGADRALVVEVPAQSPGSTLGASYSYADAAVTSGQTYYYFLEDVDLNGAATLHGPVGVTVNAPTAVTLSSLEAGNSSMPVPVAGLAVSAVILAMLGGLAWRRRLNVS